MMKTVNRALLAIIALTFSISLTAQYAGATLEYVKVKPGQWQSYMELEESAKELHQARVEKGIITRWALYRKLYTGQNDSYSHILVTLNDDIKKTQNSFPQELLDEMYTKDEQSDFMEKVWASRDIVKREYYDRVTFAEGGQPYKYLKFIRFSVDQSANWKFVQLHKEIIKPFYDEVVKRGYYAGRSVWKKDPNDHEFQFIVVNLYAEYGDWKNSLNHYEIFKEVFPNKDFQETYTTIFGTRKKISGEYWELVMSTDATTE